MKISEYFGLEKTQRELDFIDIDTEKDTRLFLDPYFISKSEFPFAINAQKTIRSYFEYLLALLHAKEFTKAERIFSYLVETNDVCLGMSKGKPRGHGMGPEDTKKIFMQLRKSKALQSGLLEDIEDFRIFVPNVDKDKVSDMIANIIKLNLVTYTIDQCKLLGIPLVSDVSTGMFWDSLQLQWDSYLTDRLIVEGKPILLVPKRIVSFSDKYSQTEYKQHFVLNFLQNEHMRFQSNFIEKRKNGRMFVTKKSILDNESKIDKDYLIRFTEKHPEVFQEFRQKTIQKLHPVSGDVFEVMVISSICNYLVQKLQSIKPGQDDATKYHHAIIGILELLFYPNLSSPKKEVEINEGRKRIDITFDNSAETGFFYRLPNFSRLPCQSIFIECKNYNGEIANPELDQISGRFSTRRGRVGIILCRALDNEDLFLRRCSDTLSDDNGLIIPLTDIDIIEAIKQFPGKGPSAIEDILEAKYRRIVK